MQQIVPIYHILIRWPRSVGVHLPSKVYNVIKENIISVNTIAE